jgi:hypothetical protein
MPDTISTTAAEPANVIVDRVIDNLCIVDAWLRWTRSPILGWLSLIGTYRLLEEKGLPDKRGVDGYQWEAGHDFEQTVHLVNPSTFAVTGGLPTTLLHQDCVAVDAPLLADLPEDARKDLVEQLELLPVEVSDYLVEKRPRMVYLDAAAMHRLPQNMAILLSDMRWFCAGRRLIICCDRSRLAERNDSLTGPVKRTLVERFDNEKSALFAAVAGCAYRPFAVDDPVFDQAMTDAVQDPVGEALAMDGKRILTEIWNLDAEHDDHLISDAGDWVARAMNGAHGDAGGFPQMMANPGMSLSYYGQYCRSHSKHPVYVAFAVAMALYCCPYGGPLLRREAVRCALECPAVLLALASPSYRSTLFMS